MKILQAKFYAKMKMMKILQAKSTQNDENSTGKIYAKMKMMKILQAKSTQK